MKKILLLIFAILNFSNKVIEAKVDNQNIANFSFMIIGGFFFKIVNDIYNKKKKLIVSKDQKKEVEEAKEYFKNIVSNIENKNKEEIYDYFLNQMILEFGKNGIDENSIDKFIKILNMHLPKILKDNNAINNPDLRICDKNLKFIKESYFKIIDILKNIYFEIKIIIFILKDVIECEDIEKYVAKFSKNLKFRYYETVKVLNRYLIKLNDFRDIDKKLFKIDAYIERLSLIISIFKDNLIYKNEVEIKEKEKISKNLAQAELYKKIVSDNNLKFLEKEAEIAAINKEYAFIKLSQSKIEKKNNKNLAIIAAAESLRIGYEKELLNIIKEYFYRNNLYASIEKIKILIKKATMEGFEINKLMDIWSSNFNYQLINYLNKELEDNKYKAKNYIDEIKNLEFIIFNLRINISNLENDLFYIKNEYKNEIEKLRYKILALEKENFELKNL